jgi:thiamine biosynthesis protein ThiS
MECTVNGQRKKMKFSGTVQRLLDMLEISEQIVLVKRNGEIITELDTVGDKDTVEIQKVILGG